jgi:ABC-type multidrug transport system ATPase subunit
VRTVSRGVEEYQKNQDGALIIITHSTRILESLNVDYTHVLVDGTIVEDGDASLVDEINENGFERFIRVIRYPICCRPEGLKPLLRKVRTDHMAKDKPIRQGY